MTMFSILLLGGCFAGFLTDYLSYQALNYQITEPRVLAVRTDPLYLLSGGSVEFDALVVAPTDDEIRSHRISVCGLGHATQTTIWNLSCFEDSTEVSELGVGMLPMLVQIPEVPEIDCDDRFEGSPVEEFEEEESEEDTGFEYIMGADPCSHNLPLLLESNVLTDKDTRKEQEKIIYGGDYATWFTESPENNNIPIARRHHELIYDKEANAGDEISLQWNIDGNLVNAAFHWYVDDGLLLQTGLTSADFEGPSETYPAGRTIVQNLLQIPDDYEGKLRIWVVAHYNWNSLMDMAWSEGVIEVQP